MAFTPDSPFPKTRGHVIKSKDWNDAITEVQRLDNAKVNKAGDNMTGPLNIAGNVGIGTTTPENSEGWQRVLDVFGNGNAKLSVRNSGIEARMMAHGGWWGAPAGMVVGTNTNHSLSFGTNQATRMTIDTAGRVGIGITTPSRHLHVQPSEIHSGGGGAGYSFGNRETAAFVESPGAGERWVWYASGGRARLWSGGDRLSAHFEGGLSNVIVGPGANGRLKTRHIDGKHHQSDNNDSLFLNYDTGQPVWLGFGGPPSSLFVSGNVGIGTTAPGFKLDVLDRIRLRQGGSGSAGLWLFQSTPGQDRAFIGMATDNSVGLWGNTGANWGLVMDTSNGDVTIRGRLGTNGFPPTPRTPGWGGGIRTWDLEVEATAWIRNTLQTGPRDLAENFSSDIDLDPGDVVCMGYDEDSVVISEKPDDGLVLGVISSRPGLLLNSDRGVEDGDTMFPVALCGCVPCKVVDENGPISRGDLLTTSSTPGHAMKASSIMLDGQEIQRPGTIIGKAVGSLKSGTGVIEVFVTAR